MATKRGKDRCTRRGSSPGQKEPYLDYKGNILFVVSGGRRVGRATSLDPKKKGAAGKKGAFLRRTRSTKGVVNQSGSEKTVSTGGFRAGQL